VLPLMLHVAMLGHRGNCAMPVQNLLRPHPLSFTVKSFERPRIVVRIKDLIDGCSADGKADNNTYL
jgi:hypothetical protein